MFPNFYHCFYFYPSCLCVVILLALVTEIAKASLCDEQAKRSSLAPEMLMLPLIATSKEMDLKSVIIRIDPLREDLERKTILV